MGGLVQTPPTVRTTSAIPVRPGLWSTSYSSANLHGGSQT